MNYSAPNPQKGDFGATNNIYAFEFGSSIVSIIIFASAIVLKMLNKLLIDVLNSYDYLAALSFALISVLRIFPLIVFGSSSTNSMIRGYLYGAVTSFT